MQAQPDAVGVGQLRRASAARDRHARADGRIEARDVAWRMKVRRGADQIRGRGPDQGARADAPDPERILMPAKGQSAAAAGNAKDEASAGDAQNDRPGGGFCRRNEGCGRETRARQNKAATRDNAHVNLSPIKPIESPRSSTS